jgi:hypothetical protein
MRHLLLATVFLSFITLAQEKTTGADEAALYRDKSGNAVLLQTNKLAAPATGVAQHQQTELKPLSGRTEVSTNTLLSNDEHGGFSCPDGTDAACLDIGDTVCPGSAQCIDDRATCFEEYPCDLSEGFVCKSQYDGILDGFKQTVRQHDELALENVALREKRLEQKNCVINASTLDDARRCVRQP